MSLARNLLLSQKLQETAIYIDYIDTSGNNYVNYFNTTAELVAFTSYNTDLVTAKIVRKNATETDVSLNSMLRACSNLTTLDLSEFYTNGVVNMGYMFYQCPSLISLDLSSFDTSSVTSMYYMLASCPSLISIDLSSFDTSSVITMAYMFSYCSSLISLDLSNFDTSNVGSMAYMLSYCSSLISLDLSNFDTSSVTNMAYMCRNCSSLESVYWATKQSSLQAILTSSYLGYYGNTIYVPSSLLSSYKSATYFSNWSSQIVGITPTPELYLIYNTETLTDERIDFDTTSAMATWISSNRDNLIGSLTAVRQNISDGFTDYSEFFGDCTQITSLDVSNFDTTGATNMYYMFGECNALAEIIGLENLNTSSVTNMEYMFGGCFAINTINASTWNTSNVVNMFTMFSDCYELEYIYLDNIDTSNVTNMDSMFEVCANVQSLYWATNKSTLMPWTSDPITDKDNAFQNATIYVPTALVNDYKSATYFSYWASQIEGV